MTIVEEIKFRPYRPDDLAGIAWLNEHAYDPAVFRRMDFDNSDVAQFARSYDGKTGLFVVGEHLGSIVAMGGFCRVSDEIAELRRMRVHPDAAYRRQGIGKKLLSLLEFEATTRGYQTMKMDTVAEQAGALEFYLGSGYTETHRNSSFVLEAIHLEKALAVVTDTPV